MIQHPYYPMLAYERVQYTETCSNEMHACHREAAREGDSYLPLARAAGTSPASRAPPFRVPFSFAVLVDDLVAIFCVWRGCRWTGWGRRPSSTRRRPLG